eukprot:3588032-Lingulodinium_polyedra.AAC.1
MLIHSMLPQHGHAHVGKPVRHAAKAEAATTMLASEREWHLVAVAADPTLLAQHGAERVHQVVVREARPPEFGGSPPQAGRSWEYLRTKVLAFHSCLLNGPLQGLLLTLDFNLKPRGANASQKPLPHRALQHPSRPAPAKLQRQPSGLQGKMPAEAPLELGRSLPSPVPGL